MVLDSASPLTPYLNRSSAVLVDDNKENSDSKNNMDTHTLPEHQLDPVQVAERYQVDVNFDDIPRSRGLTVSTVMERLLRDGRNELSPPKKTHPLIKFLKKLFGLFNLMLIVSGILGFILYIIDSSDLQNVRFYIVY